MATIPYHATQHNLDRYRLSHASIAGISGVTLTLDTITYFLSPDCPGVFPLPANAPLVLVAPVEGPLRETLAAEFAHRLWTTGGAA